MRGTRRHRAGPTLSLDLNRPPVRMGRDHGLGIAEDVIDQRHEGAESLD
jgi:hypothetical protein